MRFVNNRINESIIQDITKLLKNEDNKIIKKTIPQFKIQLFELWETFHDLTKFQILDIIPESWNDFKEMINNIPKKPVNDILA